MSIRRRCSAFTLVELLVVIGIIALLIAVLLPTLGRARDQGNTIKCASNMRQLCLALVNYAAEYKGKFPPNLNAGGLGGGQPAIAQYWYDVDRIGRYLPNTVVTGSNAIGTPVMTCPNDIETAKRSYGMSVWASSITDTFVTNAPKRGELFGTGTKGSSQLIIMTEAWSKFPFQGEWFAAAAIGYQGAKPGERFVGIAGYSAGGRVPQADTEIDYTRHRTKRNQNDGFRARGRMNLGFADGHVEMFAHDDLADPVTKKSKLRALWSPLDRQINN